MACPNCGAPVYDDQQFCRSCGSAIGDDASPLILPQTVFLISVLLMFLGIFVGVTGGIVELRWLKFTGVYITLIGFVSLVGGNLILQRIAETKTRWRIAEEKAKRRSTRPADDLNHRADTTNKLLPVGQDDFVPSSIVENTTSFLKNADGASQRGSTLALANSLTLRRSGSILSPCGKQFFLAPCSLPV